MVDLYLEDLGRYPLLTPEQEDSTARLARAVSLSATLCHFLTKVLEISDREDDICQECCRHPPAVPFELQMEST